MNMSKVVRSKMFFKSMQFALGFAAAISVGCAKKTASYSGLANGGNKSTTPVIYQGIDSRPATTSECAAGGQIYSVYLDINQNAHLDPTDTVLNTQTVCNGANGSNGTNGSNGIGLAFTTVYAPAPVCANGGTTILLASDTSGTGVYSPTLPNQQSMTICNGENGTDGADGQDGADGADGENAAAPGYSAVDTIIPCGDNVAYKEVLLRLQNGRVLGSFSDNTSGHMTRLTFLPDGTFMNTDNSGCQFTLSTQGTTRSVSWGGQVRQSWTISY